MYQREAATAKTMAVATRTPSRNSRGLNPKGGLFCGWVRSSTGSSRPKWVGLKDLVSPLNTRIYAKGFHHGATESTNFHNRGCVCTRRIGLRGFIKEEGRELTEIGICK